MGVNAAKVAITVQHRGAPPWKTEGRLGHCRGPECKQAVVFVRLPTGKVPPYNLDGTPHYATCPNAQAFRGRSTT